jgi:hypothetical protein
MGWDWLLGLSGVVWRWLAGALLRRVPDPSTARRHRPPTAFRSLTFKQGSWRTCDASYQQDKSLGTVAGVALPLPWDTANATVHAQRYGYVV